MRGLAIGLALLVSALGLRANEHVGLVTRVLATSEGIFSVSQRGVFRGTGEEMFLVLGPDFRVMDLAVLEGETGGLLVVGGVPGEGGYYRAS